MSAPPAPDTRILARNRWLARQSPELRQALFRRARVTRLDAGQWIYGTGDALNGLYGVLEGSVHLLVTPKGSEPRLIDIVQAGQLFGQAARFGGGPRLLTAIAGEPTQLLHVPDSALDEIARSTPDVWRTFTTLLYGQLAAALQFADLMHLPPARRVAIRLALLARNADAIAVTQAQLGEMTGLSRKTVNGHLRRLERKGVIALEYRRILIRDRARL
jgi:CRP-like cAMP-binding protein